jgi:hypothetical protein
MLPKRIRVGGFDYSVIETGEVLHIEGQVCKGVIDYHFHEISINRDCQDEQGKEQTFCHELVHAIMRSRNLALNEDEEFIEEFSCGLFQVLKDNNIKFGDRIDKGSHETGGCGHGEDGFGVREGTCEGLQGGSGFYQGRDCVNL